MSADNYRSTLRMQLRMEAHIVQCLSFRPHECLRQYGDTKLSADNFLRAPDLPPCPARARHHCSSSRSVELTGAGTAASPPVARSLAAPPRSDIRRDVRAPKNTSSSNPTMAQRRLTTRLIDWVCPPPRSPVGRSPGGSARLDVRTLQPLAQRLDRRANQKHPALLAFSCAAAAAARLKRPIAAPSAGSALRTVPRSLSNGAACSSPPVVA